MPAAAATATHSTGPAVARLKVLIIEDERDMRESLEDILRKEGYEVLSAADGAEGLRKAQTHLPDLVLLDLMLPLVPGQEVCRELKSGASTRHIPIIIMSAKAEETDQIVGFNLGADDYVTKPFGVKVLLERIKVRLRRNDAGGQDPAVIEHLGVRIDRVRHRAYSGDQELELTPTEFKLLECLLKQPGRAFTRHQLMEAAIGEGAVVLERTIDVHIKTLRRKLGDPELIETVRSHGYRFRERRDEA